MILSWRSCFKISTCKYFSHGKTCFSSIVAPYHSQDSTRTTNTAQNTQEINTYVAKCCKQGRISEAIDAIYDKDPSAKLTTSETYICLLECCSRIRSLKEAKRLHAHITKSEKCGHICHRVITMYTKCNSLEDALWVFDSQSRKNPVAWNAILFAHVELGTLKQAKKIFDLVPNPNITSWNGMITACAKHGCIKDSLDMFVKLLYEKHLPAPNSHTYTSVLSSVSRPELVCNGMEIHALSVKSGLDSAEIAWAVINMYAKCGKIDEAQKVFSSTSSKNVLCWAGMITACANNGKNEGALKIFQEMMEEGLTPTLAIYIKSLEACAGIEFLIGGKLIHCHLSQDSNEFIVPVANALILMYNKCKCFEDSKSIFEKLKERDVFTWNLMIKANVELDKNEEARLLFQDMKKTGLKPNVFTYSIVLDSFSSKSELKEGKSIHSEVKKCGFESNIVVRTALVNMYAKCGDLPKARILFDELEKKDVVLWTTMIGMYVRYGNGEEALDLFEKMEENGVKPDVLSYVNALSACMCPDALSKGESVHARIKEQGFESDIVVRTAIMSMYAKCGGLGLAKQVFDDINDRDVVAWTALLSIYAHELRDDPSSIMDLYKEMQKEGVKPNGITYITILDACSNASALDLGKLIHQDILGSDEKCDSNVGAALINMYTKCGTIDDVQRAFDSLTTGQGVDVWNLMIAAHVQHGLHKEALRIFEKMCEQPMLVQPNKVTFVHVLSACDNASLVSEGREFFKSMKSRYGITPLAEHYSCMVSLLGKAGLLEESESYLKDMPSEPSGFVWMTMLNACKLHGDLKRAEEAVKRVIDMDEYNVEACRILASMYDAAGIQVDDGLNITKLEDQMGNVT